MLLIQASLKLGKTIKKSMFNRFFLDFSGKQKRGALIAFFGFYLFGIPIAAVLMFFVRIDIYGFWIGLIAAETVTNTFLFILVQRFNWRRHADAALKRISFNPKLVSTNISTDANIDEKSLAMITDATIETESNNWVKLIRIKILVLVLLVCFLITGVVTSTVMPL